MRVLSGLRARNSRYTRAVNLPRRGLSVVVLLFASVYGAVGCSGEEASNASPDAATLAFADHSEGRYCEVLVARLKDGGGLTADVWNSIAHGPCPQAQWEALDTGKIKADFPDAALVVLNGPRFFLMQEIYSHAPPTVPQVHTFGGITMSLAATVGIDPTKSAPYTELAVDRDTTFRFLAGRRVFELQAADGRTYVMQSFSRATDPGLTFDEIETLAGRLTLPAGWTFTSRVLEVTLDVTADGVATVVQDDLANTYQLVAP